MATQETVLDRAKRHWISASFFICVFGGYLIGAIYLHISEIVQHILLTLTAVLGIHMLDRLFLYKDAQETLNKLVDNVKKDISRQTESMLDMSKSLDSMEKCGIVKVYTSRIDAAEDIKKDLINEQNKEIRLAGISLNDFTQTIDPDLKEAWNTIKQYVRGEKALSTGESELSIRILIIDPHCFGATLRASSEAEYSTAEALRLEKDVMMAAEDFRELELQQDSAKTGVTIEFRMYRTPPVLFLCWMDSVSYSHQYHFWSSRDNKTPIPTFKYRRLNASSTTYPYHDELKHHFDWIWRNASISVSDFINNHEVGVDDGVYKNGVTNIYTNPMEARDRIAHLLDSAESTVVIQGVSLKSYFEPGTLRESLSKLLYEGKVEIRILLLDPESEQAKYRSYRESLFEQPEQNYEDYISLGEHEKSDLYHDTNQTIKRIGVMVSDIRRHRKEEDWAPNLTVAFYDTAPSCFVLKIDDRLFSEQYHYGKVARKTKAILGKDMPLFEYSNEPSRLYEKTSNPLRMPFALLDDHLDFVIKQAATKDISKINAQQENPADP